jgi:hypothetical protein
MASTENELMDLVVAAAGLKDFSRSRALRPKAHRLIRGGAHTYAKGDDQYPEQAPAFIARGKRLPCLGPGRERVYRVRDGFTSRHARARL